MPGRKATTLTTAYMFILDVDGTWTGGTKCASIRRPPSIRDRSETVPGGEAEAVDLAEMESGSFGNSRFCHESMKRLYGVYVPTDMALAGRPPGPTPGCLSASHWRTKQIVIPVPAGSTFLQTPEVV